MTDPVILSPGAMFLEKEPKLGSRFLRYVDPGEPDECWLWHGATNPRGYGVFGIDGRSMNASRAAWVIVYGPIPEGVGLQVLHACDVPLCVNPRHLMLGTQTANVKDMDTKGRRGDTSSHGEAHPMAKLTDEQVREIRYFASVGWSRRALADRYGVHPNHIGRIVRGQQRAA